MNTPANNPREDCSIEHMQSVFQHQRRLSRTAAAPEQRERIRQLQQLRHCIKSNVDIIANAIIEDFGSRSREEILLAEVYTSLSAIEYACKHLKGWMKPQKRHVDLIQQPAKARVMFQPKGVVGIISPWNYPFFLAIGPLIAALAAGNRVMIKPSETSPTTAACLKQLLENTFGQELVYVSTGGADTGKAFSELSFDHLLFTGSTRLGRVIMRAAADNLTPVTLELGGKSPALLHPDYPLQSFSSRIIHSKSLNSGQTCVAPDYLLVPEHKLDQLIEQLQLEFSLCFPDIDNNPDYGAIINSDHLQRLQHYLDDARDKGARLIELGSATRDPAKAVLKMPLTLVLDVDDSMLVMQEEIFGAILPIKTYQKIEDALEYINLNQRPLALYYFDSNASRAEQLLKQTVSGNACINEALMHVGVDDLPFGGIGASGMGAYHGREGFETFSHKKGVLSKRKFNTANWIKPPYGTAVKLLLKLLLK